MNQLLAIALAALLPVGLALLVVRVSSKRTLSRQHTVHIPAQRSPLTQAELVKLNQAYGAGEIGEAEYTRRRKELLSRAD